MKTFTLTLSTVLFLASRVIAAGDGPQPGASYTISPAAFPNLCIAPGTDAEGSSLIVTDCDSSCSTEWVFDGQALRNAAFNKCADVTDGKAKSGTKAQVWGCYDNNPNQAFQYSNGQIKWAGNKYCFDLTNGQGTEGNKVQMWTCQGQNQNQQWDLTEMEDGPSSGPSPTTAPSPSASASQIGGNLAAGGGGINVGIGVSVGYGGGHHNTEDSPSSTAWSSSPSPTASSGSGNNGTTPGSGGNGNADMSGYLQVSGTNVVDPQGNNVMLKGTNIGGWLVWEDWMCGISDNSGSADRFPQTTLQNRFGTEQTYELLNVWQDNWFVESDFDVIASMGFNVIRLPFSYKNFLYPDGTAVTGSGNGFERLEWAISNAKKRGIYVIPTYHIWDGQEQGYSTISENSDEGQRQRDLCGSLWTQIASHFQGESAIAAFDMINEPTGSWGNILQQDLYTAIRNGDPKRIIIMESISSWPDSNWENVMYSMHEYLMMGENDFSGNQAQFWSGVNGDVTTYRANGVPAYVGEFMASGDTLQFMLDQMNNMNVWWSGWAYKTVNMDRWGLMNFGQGNWVSVSDDSFDSLKSAWSNMGGITKSRVYDTYVAACGSNNWKRSVPAGSPQDLEERAAELVIPAVRDEPIAVSPRVEQPTYVPRTKRAKHGGRSRRIARHGKVGRI